MSSDKNYRYGNGNILRVILTQRRKNYLVSIDGIENEKTLTDLSQNNLVWILYWFVDFFNIAFFRGQPVPIPLLTFERTRVDNLGHFKTGFNDFALRNKININRLYIKRPLNQILQTLIHELVHSWEHIYVPEKKRTKSWYHTKAFRVMLGNIGIVSDLRGRHLAVGDPFVHLLRQHGVYFKPSRQNTEGLTLIPKRAKPKGRSKLKKWSCGCQNVRVGKATFKATCDICSNKFKPQN